MNLNPLFWVNELKEMGQGMKATGPITATLWCIILPHSLKWLCTFCLHPLFFINYSVGVRVRAANCADGPALRMAAILQKLTPSLAVLRYFALCQLIQFFDIFSFSLSCSTSLSASSFVIYNLWELLGVC